LKTRPRLKKISYRPDPANRRTYDYLYARYRRLHDGFGGRRKVDFSRLMKDLLDLRLPSASATPPCTPS
jgi:hypothetical protein